MPDKDRVLVTGASGFIGGAVCRALENAGYDVRALVRKTSPRTNIRASMEIVEGEITDVDAVRKGVSGCRFVVHTAANYRLWTPAPKDLIRVNVEGAQTVMREALREGVERIVYTSSVATLSPQGDSGGDEEMRLPLERAIGPYKRSKILCERLVEALIEKEKLPAVIVNPSAPLGPGDVRPTPTGRIVVEAMHGGIPAFVETGLNVAHVDDVAQGHVLALHEGRIGERYILGGDNISLVTLLAEVAQLTNRKAPHLRLPRAPLVPIALLNEAFAYLTRREPLLNLESLRLSATPMYFDDSKARRELGYVSRSHQEAIADAVEWFRHQRMTGA